MTSACVLQLVWRSSVSWPADLSVIGFMFAWRSASETARPASTLVPTTCVWRDNVWWVDSAVCAWKIVFQVLERDTQLSRRGCSKPEPGCPKMSASHLDADLSLPFRFRQPSSRASFLSFFSLIYTPTLWFYPHSTSLHLAGILQALIINLHN